VGELNDGFHFWFLKWHRNIFVWENEILVGLLGVLEGVKPMAGEDGEDEINTRSWGLNCVGFF